MRNNYIDDNKVLVTNSNCINIDFYFKTNVNLNKNAHKYEGLALFITNCRKYNAPETVQKSHSKLFIDLYNNAYIKPDVCI